MVVALLIIGSISIAYGILSIAYGLLPMVHRQNTLLDRAASALTLSDEELHLLRGMPLHSLLRSGASVLANSKGSSATYKLGRVCD